jgi:hypothetical protein
VDTYFLYNPHQLKAFQRFYAAGKDEVKSSWPDVSVGVVFAFNDFRVSDSVFRALVPNCDHVSFTYYPIRTNMRLRKPAVARSDIAEMVEAAGDKKLILTEIGYPSAESLGSSVDLQNEFYRNAFDALQAQPNRIAGAAFFLMSDIPTDVVTVLTEYYHLSSDEAFTTFLATLGVHDLQGAEKPAWRMFADRTKQLRELEACVAE